MENLDIPKYRHPPVILQKLQEDMELRGFSDHSKDYYYRDVRKFLEFYNRQPEELGEKEIRAYNVLFIMPYFSLSIKLRVTVKNVFRLFF